MLFCSTRASPEPYTSKQQVCFLQKNIPASGNCSKKTKRVQQDACFLCLRAEKKAKKGPYFPCPAFHVCTARSESRCMLHKPPDMRKARRLFRRRAVHTKKNTTLAFHRAVQLIQHRLPPVFPRGGHVQDTLIARTAETQFQRLLFFHKRPVHQKIQQRQKLPAAFLLQKLLQYSR